MLKPTVRRIFLLIMLFVALSGFYAVAAKWWIFKNTVTSGVEVQQEPFKAVYDLVDSRNKKIIVKDVGGWIVSGRFVFGSSGESDYYLFDRTCRRAETYRTIKPFLIALSKLNAGNYSYSEEEGPADLIYNRHQSRFLKVGIPSGACDEALRGRSEPERPGP